jgi:DNA modification methylase
MFLKSGQEYEVILDDCIEVMARMPSRCIDMAIYSPPFPQLYSYSSSDADIGNSENLKGDAKLHLSYFYNMLSRLLKPGRVVVCHVAQIPRMKRSGGVGMFDFRGLNIRLAERAGLIFEYDWAVRKNPQAQAITTKSRELQFAGLESDRARSRGAMPDYLLKFTAPGDNAIPVVSKGDVSRNDWIEWAECTWTAEKYPISADGRHKAMTLNVEEGRSDDDTRHICPLQLSVIDRLIRLYTNPNEIVFSPFCGIGSEGFVARRLGRRFYGCELKPEYHATALRNIARAEVQASEQMLLFGGPETEDETEADEEPEYVACMEDLCDGDQDSRD